MVRRSRYFGLTHRGLTVLELLICIMILSIFTSLTITSITGLRESARAVNCRNNLRQIGIAIQAYTTVLEVLPPGQYGIEGNSYNEISPFLKLLPYLNQSPIYNSFNYLHMDRDSSPRIENRTVRETRLNLYICPSDTGPVHLNSYAFNVGRSIYHNGVPSNNGPFGLFKILKPENISSGISHLTLLSERIVGGFDPERIISNRDFKIISFGSIKDYSDDLAIPLCEETNSNKWYRKSGRYWLYWSPFHTVYSHSSMPNDLRSACGGFFFGILPARSNHVGGVHVLFGDSHTEKITSTINQEVWERLGACY